MQKSSLQNNTTMNAISVNNIIKTYNKGEVKAVQNVSFEVKKGELFGLIGPDGAGKSTIFRILTTLLLADSGTAEIEGLDTVRDYRKLETKSAICLAGSLYTRTSQ